MQALAASFQFGICEVFRDIDLITESAWDSLFRFIIDIFKYGIRLEESALKSNTITWRLRPNQAVYFIEGVIHMVYKKFINMTNI